MKLVCLCTAWTLLAPQAVLGYPKVPLLPSRAYQNASTPAEESRTPAVVIGTKEERVAKAAGHYEGDRFVQAALEFEGLWKDFREPAFLFNAAASRHAAGHHAHAVAYSREYLARSDISAEDRAEAKAQLGEALTHVQPVRVKVTVAPGGGGAVRVVAQHIARESADLRPDLLFPVSPSDGSASLTLELDPGLWAIQAQGPDYRTVEQRVQVNKGANLDEVALQVSLVPRPLPGGENVAPDLAPETVKKVTVGLGIAGGAIAVAGTAMVIVGGLRVRSVGDFETAGGTPPERTNNFSASLRLREAGVLVLGSGAGVVAGGLTWLIKDPQRRQIAWIAEAAVGGVAIGAGVAGLFVSPVSFNRENIPSIADTADEWGTHYQRHHRSVGHAFSALSVGLGAGLAASALTSLILQRTMRPKLQVNPDIGPNRAALVLSGNF